jgi:hypothetical protein
LEAGGKVGRLAGYGARLRHSLLGDVADDHQTRRNSHPSVEPGIRVRRQAVHRLQGNQARSYRALDIVLMGLRVAEINKDPIAQILRYITIEAADRLRHDLVE